MREKINERFFTWTNKILDIVDNLDNNISLKVISNQIARSCTSSGANYRASGRAKSTKDMIYKLKIAEEEIDETIYWLEVISFRTKINVSLELKEGKEFLAIVVSSILSLRKKL